MTVKIEKTDNGRYRLFYGDRLITVNMPASITKMLIESLRKDGYRVRGFARAAGGRVRG